MRKYSRIPAGKLFLYLFLFLISIARSQTNMPEYRSVWLSRDVIIRGRESIRTAFSNLKNAGFNAVLVNNWYQGSTIYYSEVLADYGATSQLPEFVGWDPLEVVIEEAHRIGLEIHVWFEYGLWGHVSYDAGSLGPLLSGRTNWLMKDRSGNNYAIMWVNSTPLYQFWMDPAEEEVVTFLVKLYRECARNYPDLDGIQTDRIRYPNPQFSFSDISRQVYQAETGGSDPISIQESDPEWNNFVVWRERKTSDLAGQIFAAVKAENPRCIVSAAVGPPYMLQGSDDKLQDWPTWFREGAVDLLFPMLYDLHSNLDYWLRQCLDQVASPLNVIPGVNLRNSSTGQLYSNNTLDNVMSQIRYRNMPGIGVWYFGDLEEDRLKYFKDQTFYTRVHTLRDEIIVDNQFSDYVASESMTEISGGFLDDHLSGSGAGAHCTWQVPVFITGAYHLFAYLPEAISGGNTQRYSIQINGNADLISIPGPQLADTWIHLGRLDLDYDDSLRVQVENPGGGKVIADAVRLFRITVLKIEEGYVADSTLYVRFNLFLDTESARDLSRYAIQPYVDIRSVEIDPENRSFVRLHCSAFMPEVDYKLIILGLHDAEGNAVDTLRLQFSFDPGNDEMIDNKSSLFYIQSGAWEELNSPSAVDATFLRTPCGDGTSRVYWRYTVPENGYYKILAFFPDSAAYASDGMYIVRNDTKTDTVLVNQQTPAPNGFLLATTWAEKGDNLIVKLHNQSQHGADYWVVADAVQFARGFPATSLVGENKATGPEIFQVFPNYPNPFNASTVIPYSVLKSGTLDWQVYDVTGKLVADGSEAVMNPGGYKLFMNFHDRRSGVYLYRLSFLDRSRTGKMVYLK